MPERLTLVEHVDDLAGVEQLDRTLANHVEVARRTSCLHEDVGTRRKELDLASPHQTLQRLPAQRRERRLTGEEACDLVERFVERRHAETIFPAGQSGS